MTPLPTYYKNRKASTCPCLVCQTATIGNASDFYLGHGVTIRLCERHASRQFIEADNGRHFELAIHLGLRSAGRLTKRHVTALTSFVSRFSNRHESDRLRTGATLPGSYAWAEIRARLEARLENGALSIQQMVELVTAWLRVELRRGVVTMPSLRTLRRWRFERRWASRDPRGMPG